jgi:hypothetical protein
VELVGGIPFAYGELLQGCDGSEKHPDLGWSVTGYVCHVGDNLRIWAERLAGINAGAPIEVGGYDQDLLADARRYGAVSLEGAIWSLHAAARDWSQVVGQVLGSPDRTTDCVVIVHPDRGPQTLTEVVLSNAHDAIHHSWDIRRSIEASAN